MMLMLKCLFRFVATELATDIVITVGDVKFYLHKVQIQYSFCSCVQMILHISFASNVKCQIPLIKHFYISHLKDWVSVISFFFSIYTVSYPLTSVEVTKTVREFLAYTSIELVTADLYSLQSLHLIYVLSVSK